MKIKYQSFPNYLAPDSEKDTEEYGLKMGEAIQYEWFNKPSNGGACTYYDRRQKYHTLRLYGRGEQSSDLYKKMLSKGTTSYTNYDWRPLQVIPKFVKLITNQMSERLYEVGVNATDKYSTDLRNKQKEYLQNIVASKPIFDLAQQTFGVNIAPPDMDELPKSNEEVDLWMDMKYKPSIEIAAEQAIKFTLDANDYDEIQNKLIEDITVIGIAAVKHTTDPTKGIQVKLVDPADLVFSYPRQRNFKDVHYFGEVEKMTVNELKRITGDKFTDEQIKELGFSNREWQNYHGNTNGDSNYKTSGDLDGMMVDVLNFTFKSTNTITYKKKFTKTGGYNMTKKDSTFNVKKGSEDGYEVIKKTIDVWYEGSMVLGTQLIFNYRKCENMVRPKGFLNQTAPNYIVYAPELYQNRTKSLVERIIPYVDQMQQIHIKLQQLIAKARPNGIYIDVDGLSEVDLGDGNFLTPLELVKIYDETGNVLGTSINSEGEYNYGKEPIRELKNGIVDGLDRLINAYNHYLNLLRDSIGIPAGADASTPNADLAVGVQQQMALNSNTATRHILDGVLSITKNLASGLSLRIKDIFKYSDLKEVYINAIGKLGVEALKSMQDYALYDLGINITIKPDAEEKQYLEQNIQMALSKDLITITDAIDIRSIGNIKLANKVIEIRCKQRIKEKKQEALDMIQANSEAQIKSAQAAAEAKMQEVQTEIQGKIALKEKEGELKERALKLEAELKGSLMDKEFDFNMQLRGMDMKIKSDETQMKEKNKFDLQNLRDTNDSKKTEQKKFNQPAINFESSEDNLSGSMELSEMNPD